MFDQVAEAEIVLHNTGKVGFDFQAINMDPSTGRRPVPGLPVMIPHAGRIEALQELKLLVKFLPGVPEKFHKSFDVSCCSFSSFFMPKLPQFLNVNRCSTPVHSFRLSEE